MNTENHTKDQIISPIVLMISLGLFSLFSVLSYDNHKRANPENHSIYAALEEFYIENVAIF